MSLLDDLSSIDLEGILQARGTLSLTVQADDLQALVSSGAAQSALGGLGEAIGLIRAAVDDPEALLQPLAEALQALLAQIDPEDLPLGEYAEAVHAGAQIVVGLLEGFARDPSALRVGDLSLGQMLERASAALGNQQFVSGEAAEGFQRLVEQAGRGVPRDPAAFARFAAEALLPFSPDALLDVQRHVRLVLDGSAGLSLPAAPAAPLVTALDAVASAAAGADAAALERALRDAQRVHAETLRRIEQGMTALSNAVESLGLDRVVDALQDASRLLQVKDLGILEQLERWRVQIADMRRVVEEEDLSSFYELMSDVLDSLETLARERLIEPVEEQIRVVERWLRGLLADLGLRRLRGEVTRFILSIADRIREADLGRFAREVIAVLDRIESAVSAPNLIGNVQAALGDVFGSVDAALGTIETQLGAVVAAIDETLTTAADEINRILGQAVAALQAFQQALVQAQQAIDQLGIEAAGEEVVRRITELRQTAEELLTVAPLPDSMRPLVEQLIAQIEGLDLDAVLLQPVEDAARQIRLPDEAGEFIDEALRQLSDVLHNLIPAQLVEEIRAEFQEMIETLARFDPSTLLDEVTGFLDEAAGFLRALDPHPLPDAVRAPYLAVLEGLDALRPSRLLQPVISAYDGVFGGLQTGGFEAIAAQTTQLFESATGAAAAAVSAPLEAVIPGARQQVQVQQRGAGTAPAGAGGAASTPAPAAGAAAGGDGAPAELYLDSFRPGDLVREVLGFVPRQIRALLAELDESAAGELLDAIDAITGGLARDLRLLARELRAVERRLDDWLDAELAPLAQAHVRARLAVRLRASAGGFDATASFQALAQIGPHALRGELAASAGRTRDAARRLAGLVGGQVAVTLEQTAGLLERTQLARIGRDVNAFLDALDPEPIAAEMDALVAAVLRRMPEVLEASEEVLRQTVLRFRRLLEELNPGRQAHRFLPLLDVLREEIDLLNPRLLARELDEIHAAVRDAITEYDPDRFAQEVGEIVHALADSLEALDPSELLGNLDAFGNILERLEGIDPAGLLEGIGDDIAAVGEQLAAIDPDGLIAEINELPPRIAAQFRAVVEAAQQEILALLRAIRYAAGSAGASVEVGGSIS